MSRKTRIMLALIFLIGVGVGFYYWRNRPSALDVEAPNLPDLPEVKVAADDWPWWRGPTRDGNAVGDAPTRWSETENIVWKTPIPGRGHSSPIVFGNRVYLTSADDQKQFAAALDRDTGSIVWTTTLHEGKFGTKHGDNTFATPTSCCDGERLFVAFQNDDAIHVAALNLDGTIAWRMKAGPTGGGGSHGSAASLALWGKNVFMSDDTPGGGWIAGLYRTTGQYWRKGRRTGMGSYGSPTIAVFNGKPHLILAGNGNITAYEPDTGREIWNQTGLGEVSANTVAVGPNMVFASSGVPHRTLLALRPDGSVAWTKKGDQIPYPPSMLWHDGHLYVLSDRGQLTCFQADQGEEKWNERVRGSYYASPIAAGGRIYICNREGLTTVLEANPEGMVEVARNKLDTGIDATPAACGGRLYLRTTTHLYCIGKR